MRGNVPGRIPVDWVFKAQAAEQPIGPHAEASTGRLEPRPGTSSCIQSNVLTQRDKFAVSKAAMIRGWGSVPIAESTLP